MKAPLSWLKDFCDIDCSASELEAKLFSCGFEVEETVYFAKNIEKIVTCKILSIDKHPNADKLSVTMVDAGQYGKRQIITAAKNIFLGAVVPVALDGATLFNGDKIYNGELRGLPSFGMFCSGEELGINDDWYEGASVNGILILDQNFPLGVEVKELLELEDVIFDINVTANRPDCQSILGLAREVSAILGKPFKAPDLSFDFSKNVSTKGTIKVNNHATDLCYRYMSKLVKDVKIEKSPTWLRRRLFSMGVRSINNIVDITNYVLLEIGQPMHAFDLNFLKGNEINVRRANENEKIVTLDEKEFTLTNKNLVIADAESPVALAGVMGGLNSGINQDTKDIVFESATFARDNIRKTSRSLGQRSDSSSRYEKGIDPYTAKIGLYRALHLISKLNAGKIAFDEYDLLEKPIENKIINTKLSKVNEVLGIDIPKETVENILNRLFFNVKINGDNMEIIVPPYREDVESYPDIAEEIIREYGYDHITPTLLKTSKITNGGKNNEQQFNDNLKDLLVGFGFNEIITYSFVSEKEYQLFGIEKNAPEHKFIKILNPLGEDLSVMRTTLIPSITRIVGANLNRKNNEGRLFEIAKVYYTEQDQLTKLPVEKTNLSIALFGENEDFFTTKGVVEGVLSTFVFGANIEYIPCDLNFMHPTRSAFVKVDGEILGYIGQLSPIVLEKLGIDKPIYIGEIYLDILKNKLRDKIVYAPVSKFPIVERDLAILVDKDLPCAKIENCIKRNAGGNLTELKLFDVYQGEQVDKNKKSMAFNLIFVSNERTLSVEEIDQAVNNVLTALENDLNAKLR